MAFTAINKPASEVPTVATSTTHSTSDNSSRIPSPTETTRPIKNTATVNSSSTNTARTSPESDDIDGDVTMSDATVSELTENDEEGTASDSGNSGKDRMSKASTDEIDDSQASGSTDVEDQVAREAAAAADGSGGELDSSKRQRKRKSTITQLPGEVTKKGRAKNGLAVATSSSSGSDAGDEAETDVSMLNNSFSGTPSQSSIKGPKKPIPEGYTIAPSGRKIKNDHPPGSRMCHMCHVFVVQFASCTVLKTRAKGKTVKCDLAWCPGCLDTRYSQDYNTIISTPRPKDLSNILGHASDTPYIYKCPVCSGNCNCSAHRKKAGLPLAGNIKHLSQITGKTVQELLNNDEELAKAKELDRKQREESGKSMGYKTAPTDSPVGSDGMPKRVPMTEEERKRKKAEQQKRYKEKARLKAQAEKAAVAGDEDAKNEIVQKIMTIAPEAPPVMIMPTIQMPSKPYVKKPRNVEPPHFEYIAIDFPIGIIRARLQIREFVLRFEKHFQKKLASKYRTILNNPNGEWTDLLYKNLLISLMTIINDDPPPGFMLHPDITYDLVKTLSKTPADSPNLFDPARDFLDQLIDLPAAVAEAPNAPESHRLDIITWLLEFAVSTPGIRAQLEADEIKDKANHKAQVEETKRLESTWREVTKPELQKQRLTVTAANKAEFDERYAAAQTAHKKLLHQASRKFWMAHRKLSLRTNPLGRDVLGNMYYLFLYHYEKEEDWGHWIVVEKAEELQHPSGKEITEDDPEHGKMWFAVSGKEQLQRLAKWVRFRAEEKTWLENSCQSPTKARVEVRVPPRIYLQDVKDLVNRLEKAAEYLEEFQ
ncbi:hypothetical protein EX30DRAFT_371580 [Ascodesmis nigricans]|uniref:Zinc-finger domain-containing protein n=1 Tax=Ascodesmis nigricans TaxID=341454 RepID=A0A4S2MX34_9PEZI|nr:hypothetical protein EX30DRAFT_371580 [Ascodesmis nigricans]